MKPRAVLHAQYALAIWTAWTCLFGIYQGGNQGGAEQDMAAQLQELAGITLQSVRQFTVAIYAIVAVSMIGVIAQIGAGRTWPRTLIMVGFVLEALWVAGNGHAHAVDYLADVPDFGLQGYALYLLYAKPGSEWFKRKAA